MHFAHSPFGFRSDESDRRLRKPMIGSDTNTCRSIIITIECLGKMPGFPISAWPSLAGSRWGAGWSALPISPLLQRGTWCGRLPKPTPQGQGAVRRFLARSKGPVGCQGNALIPPRHAALPFLVQSHRTLLMGTAPMRTCVDPSTNQHHAA